MDRTRFSVLILLIISAFSAGCAAETVKLVPQAGIHQFPFFSTPTTVWNYNRQIPGPVIRVKQGSHLSVEVHNQLQEPTSIHWHGLRIDNAMDGVPGVTQSPILPGDRFSYQLNLADAGTFWYHPHFNAGEQLERGLKGVLIVEEAEQQAWSQDVAWLMDDWRFQRDGSISPHFNTHHDLMHEGRWGNAITVNGTAKPELLAAPGERIRLRLINGANARIFAVDLVGLTATVIAVDGRPVSRFFPLEQFIMSPGNRVDLDVTIPQDAARKTYALIDGFTRRQHTLGTIRVEDVPAVDPPMLNLPTAADFIPANIFKDTPVRKTWNLTAERGGQFGIGWAMNRHLWPEADTADLPLGKPWKVKFNNISNRLHPMHIHGVFFRVLEVNGQPVDEPFTRDTVLVGPRESMVIGMIPEHQGIWLTHCHIQTHAEAGMMTTIDVR